MYRKKEKGFTLIELLVVIAILGTLVGVAVPQIIGAVANARRNTNVANQVVLQSAVERYQIDLPERWPTLVNGGPLPLAGNVLPIIATELRPYIRVGLLPPIQRAFMVAGPPPSTEVLPDMRWGLNERGIVVIIQALPNDILVWTPPQ